MKKLLILLAILALMFAEYRFIMTSIIPSFSDEGFLQLEVFGMVDEYYVE